MTTITNRRALLAGVAAVPLAVAVQASSGACVADDPAFAAVERHRAAAAVWVTHDYDRDPALDDELAVQDNAALEALLRVKPTTTAGLCAVLRYLHGYCGKHGIGPFAAWRDGPASAIGDAGAELFNSIADTIETLASGRVA
jgi:hypothetical protein